MESRLLASLVVCFIVVLLACTGGPRTPTAEQYFADAKNNLAALDFDTALKNLDRLFKAAGEQHLGQQGILLRTALLTAMAEGSKEMAEAYEAGIKQDPAKVGQAEFAKMRSDYYGIVRVRLMQAMESAMEQRSKLANRAMELELPFPAFTRSEHAAIAKIKSGYWVEEGDRYRAELESVRNALARTLARLAGAGEDVHEGRARFEKGGIHVDPRVYLIELSSTFLRLAEIFDPRTLDVRYRRISLEVVRDNMDAVLKLLETEPDKALVARAKKIKTQCEKSLKGLGT